MTKYARVVDGKVMEIFTLPDEPAGLTITDCFHPEIPGKWIECTAVEGVSDHWTYDGSNFAPPQA